MSIQVGDVAPAFELPANGGKTVFSVKLRGKPYVVYFYPKADTSGCTKEAVAFEEALPKMGKFKLDVIGISRDPVKALDKFAEKYGLTFPLASDVDGTLTEAYGVWVEKSMYGKKYMGIERSTFLIGSDGKVAKIWPKVKVEGHAAEVIAAAKALGG